MTYILILYSCNICYKYNIVILIYIYISLLTVITYFNAHLGSLYIFILILYNKIFSKFW